MNLLTIMGFLGSDSQVKEFENGKKLSSFTMCVKKGKDSFLWYKISCWNSSFDKIFPHLKKGSRVIVSGDLQIPKIYKDKTGKDAVHLEINPYSIHFVAMGEKTEIKNSASVFENV